MKTVLVVVASFLLAISSVNAYEQSESWDGNELKRRLAIREDNEAYISASLYWSELIRSKDSSVACVPSDVKLLQVVDVVYKYLADHPEKLHENAKDLFRTAMSSAFPCRK